MWLAVILLFEKFFNSWLIDVKQSFVHLLCVTNHRVRLLTFYEAGAQNPINRIVHFMPIQHILREGGKRFSRVDAVVALVCGEVLFRLSVAKFT